MTKSPNHQARCLALLESVHRFTLFCMIEDVRHHLEAGPSEPFVIVTSSGDRYDVPSPDHAGINPRGNRVVIWFDDGGSITLSALHITAVEKIAGAKK